MVQDMRLIELKGVSKSFGDTQVLHDVNLYIRKCEFITLLGPSGCGKTTMLRIIGGFETPSEGEVYFDGKDLTGIPPYKRRINTVFQKYALFTHLNVFDNIAFGLKLKTPETLGVKTKREAKAEIEKRVQRMLKLVKMEGYEKRSVDSLSGGQQQRIAIARALVNEPEVLLLDEPLGALDLKLRQQMQTELKEIQKTLGIAFVYITHDQEEALNMSDRIAVMREGRLEQVGTPEAVYEHPATPVVASFIGQTNFLKCRVGAVEGNALTLHHGDVRFPARRDVLSAREGDEVLLCLRAERVKISPIRQGECCVEGTLAALRYAGGSMRASVLLADGQQIAVQCPSMAAVTVQPGQKAYLCWNAEEAAVVREDDHATA